MYNGTVVLAKTPECLCGFFLSSELIFKCGRISKYRNLGIGGRGVAKSAAGLDRNLFLFCLAFFVCFYFYCPVNILFLKSMCNNNVSYADFPPHRVCKCWVYVCVSA